MYHSPAARRLASMVAAMPASGGADPNGRHDDPLAPEPSAEEEEEEAVIFNGMGPGGQGFGPRAAVQPPNFSPGQSKEAVEFFNAEGVSHSPLYLPLPSAPRCPLCSALPAALCSAGRWLTHRRDCHWARSFSCSVLRDGGRTERRGSRLAQRLAGRPLQRACLPEEGRTGQYIILTQPS